MTTTKPVARLEGDDPRDIWQSEAGRFTPWLTEEEIIAFLENRSGLNLEVEIPAQDAGPFGADTLYKNAPTTTQSDCGPAAR